MLELLAARRVFVLWHTLPPPPFFHGYHVLCLFRKRRQLSKRHTIFDSLGVLDQACHDIPPTFRRWRRRLPRNNGNRGERPTKKCSTSSSNVFFSLCSGDILTNPPFEESNVPAHSCESYCRVIGHGRCRACFSEKTEMLTFPHSLSVPPKIKHRLRFWRSPKRRPLEKISLSSRSLAFSAPFADIGSQQKSQPKSTHLFPSFDLVTARPRHSHAFSREQHDIAVSRVEHHKSEPNSA